jgi:Ketosteroid isomerase-related protein
MTQESDNVAVLKDAYAQWAGQKGADCECWMNIIAEDVSLSSLANGSPEMAFSTPRNGKSQILDYLQELGRDWEMIDFDMGDFIAQGDRVVAIGRVAWRNKATGKIADTLKVDIWRFQDGKAVEMAEFYDTACAFAAATP